MTDRPMSDERISSMSQIEELVERLKGPMPNRAAAVQDMKGVNVIEFDWLKIEAERNEAAAALTTLLRERDEARETLSDLHSGKSAVLPHSRDHAEKLYTIAVACLKQYGSDPEARAESAEAQVERMREALEPFADIDGEGDEDFADDTPVEIKFGRSAVYTAKLGDFRRARAALEPKP